jgi:hypothetical protein
VISVDEFLNDEMKTPTALAEWNECNKDWKVIIQIIIRIISESGW